MKLIVPHKPPFRQQLPAARGADSLAVVPQWMSTESCLCVSGRPIGDQLLCFAMPDLSSLLCDGPVVVEVCKEDASGDEWWTSDDRTLFLHSAVDPSRLKFSGHGVSPTSVLAIAGEQSIIRVVTFDDRGRRRETDTDRFSCALRGRAPPAEGEEVVFVLAEVAASNLGNGMHELCVLFERAGEYILVVRLNGETVSLISSFVDSVLGD